MAGASYHKHYEPSTIDYRKLAAAQDYYESVGYAHLEAPWVVEPSSTNVTLPIGRVATAVSYGDLVGSGEQSFIELLRRGESIGRAYCVTPCFRLEESYDELHHAYFMKLELIDTQATQDNLHQMISRALSYFSRYLDAAVIKTGEDMFDIVSRRDGVELGSYGLRELDGAMFIYGTGVALPRLDTAIQSAANGSL